MASSAPHRHFYFGCGNYLKTARRLCDGNRVWASAVARCCSNDDVIAISTFPALLITRKQPIPILSLCTFYHHLSPLYLISQSHSVILARQSKRRKTTQSDESSETTAAMAPSLPFTVRGNHFYSEEDYRVWSWELGVSPSEPLSCFSSPKH